RRGLPVHRPEFTVHAQYDGRPRLYRTGGVDIWEVASRRSVPGVPSLRPGRCDLNQDAGRGANPGTGDPDYPLRAYTGGACGFHRPRHTATGNRNSLRKGKVILALRKIEECEEVRLDRLCPELSE